MVRFGSALAMALTASMALAQDPPRLYTQPSLPAKEALERHNLKMAWSVKLPTEQRRDGIFSVQVAGDQVLVQTNAGAIIALDATDGSMRWSTRVGFPYRGIWQLLGWNRTLVFATRAERIYALNRQTGKTVWEFLLPQAPTGAPASDQEKVYLCLAPNTIAAYDLPDLVPAARPINEKQQDKPFNPFDRGYSTSPLASIYKRGSTGSLGAKFSARQYGMTDVKGPQLRPDWSYDYAHGRFEQTPLVTDEALFAVTAEGTVVATDKEKNRYGQERYRFQARQGISAPMGQNRGIAFVPSKDHNVYSLDINSGAVNWRYSAGSPISRKPEVTDDSVYIVPDSGGMVRLSIRFGDFLWRHEAAVRFLAANPKFVYAMDRSGRMLVLDLRRGTLRGTLDTREFPVPISNDATDRVFLAADNGLLVCLHDRDYAVAKAMRTIVPLKSLAEKQRELERKEKPKDKKAKMDDKEQ